MLLPAYFLSSKGLLEGGSPFPRCCLVTISSSNEATCKFSSNYPRRLDLLEHMFQIEETYRSVRLGDDAISIARARRNA